MRPLRTVSVSTSLNMPKHRGRISLALRSHLLDTAHLSAKIEPSIKKKTVVITITAACDTDATDQMIDTACSADASKH